MTTADTAAHSTKIRESDIRARPPTAHRLLSPVLCLLSSVPSCSFRFASLTFCFLHLDPCHLCNPRPASLPPFVSFVSFVVPLSLHWSLLLRHWSFVFLPSLIPGPLCLDSADNGPPFAYVQTFHRRLPFLPFRPFTTWCRNPRPVTGHRLPAHWQPAVGHFRETSTHFLHFSHFPKGSAGNKF